MNWQRLATLAEQYGDSYYLLDVERFKSNHDQFLQALLHHYPRVRFAYSYKTNYLPPLCRWIDEQGGYAEVVSAMEYQFACAMNIEASRIIFNGPCKERPALLQALRDGALINLDSVFEVEAVEAAARTHPDRDLVVGLRCNLALPDEPMSRFGLSVGGEDFHEALGRLRKIPNCRVSGLQCHVLTRERSIQDYRRVAEQMVAAAQEYLSLEELRFIDLGGGFFSRMPPELERQFGVHVPSFGEYAEAIGSVFAACFHDSKGPELILEPGLCITADVMRFVAKVLDIKRLRGKVFALVAGSVYDVKPTKATRQLPVQAVSRRAAGPRVVAGSAPLDIVGYTCMEDDILRERFDAELEPGDFVVFENVGAYTIVLKPPFIAPAAPIVSVDQDLGVLDVVRRRETVDDLFRTYVF